MPRKKITQEEYSKKLLETSNSCFIPLTQYQGAEELITIKCTKHNIIMTNRARRFISKKADNRCTCPECKKEKISNSLKKEGSMEQQCAYCGKVF